MPNLNEVLGGLLANALKNPKSSCQSILTILLVLVPTLMSAGVLHGKAAAIAGSLLSVAKLWLGMLEKDAGHTTAIVPGVSEPIEIESHEIPNDPAATPVTDPKV